MSEEEELNGLRCDVHVQRLVIGQLQKELGKTRENLKNCEKKLENVREVNRNVTLRCNDVMHTWRQSEQRHLAEMNACVERIRKEKQDNALLRASIQALVDDWLTPEQREALQKQDAYYEKKKQLTLERKTAQDRRSSE